MRKNHSKKVISLVVVSLLVIPQMAFAVWWDPFSWFSGHQLDQTSSVASLTTPLPVQEAGELTTFSWWNPATWFDEHSFEVVPVPIVEKNNLNGQGAAEKVPSQEKGEHLSSTAPKQNTAVVNKQDQPPVSQNESTQEKEDEHPTIIDTTVDGIQQISDAKKQRDALEKQQADMRKKEEETERELVAIKAERERLIEDRKQKVVDTQDAAPTQPPTYKELHCPQIMMIKDSLGNVGRHPFQGFGIRGEFTKGMVDTITLEITATDPQGFPVYFKHSTPADWSSEPLGNVLSLEDAYTFDVSNSSAGVHIVTVEIDNRDDFNCQAGRESDAVRQLEYSIYPN